MTERLTQLMQREAGALDLPVPPAAEVLSAGRRLRVRRQVTTFAAGAVALVVVGSSTALWAGRDHTRAADPATHSTPAPPAYAAGSLVVVGDKVATVPDTVHSLHYTSAGVLVRSNPNDGSSDGSGPESLTLVRSDGTTKDLGTIPEGVGPATDPDQPYYVLAEAAGDGFVAVVRDAETGDEVTRVGLPDLPKSYWPVPPLGLDGNTLYVGYRSSTVAVDWHNGDSHAVDGLPGGIPEVYGGHAVVSKGAKTEVVDAATGALVLDLPLPGDPNLGESGVNLSPDGRFALVWARKPGSYDPADTFTVYEAASGHAQEFRGDPFGWGWTADGAMFKVKDGTVTTCVATTGSCSDSPTPDGIGKKDVRLGGVVYES